MPRTILVVLDLNLLDTPLPTASPARRRLSPQQLVVLELTLGGDGVLAQSLDGNELVLNPSSGPGTVQRYTRSGG